MQGMASHESLCADNGGDELWRVNPVNPSDTSGAFGGLVGSLPAGLGTLVALLLMVVRYTGRTITATNYGASIPDNSSDTSGVYGMVGSLPGDLPNPQGMASHEGSLYCLDGSRGELWRVNPDNPSDTSGDYGLVGSLPCFYNIPAVSLRIRRWIVCSITARSVGTHQSR